MGKESWNWMSLLHEVFVIPIKIFVWGGGVGGGWGQADKMQYVIHAFHWSQGFSAFDYSSFESVLSLTELEIETLL